MAFDFNPITGQLDLVGGGSSYIDGVVADSSLLPVTLGTPPLDAVYLAKVGSGVWLIARKPAGLYVRVANNGVAADWTYLGAFPEVNADGNWELYNTADPTKELKFDLTGISPSTTRTLTVPNASGTIARTEDFAAPPAIGNTTANSGYFTTLNAAYINTSGFVISFNADAQFDAVFGGIRLGANKALSWSNTNGNPYGGSPDLRLWRDAANILAQYNGSSPQNFRLYGSYSLHNIFERLSIRAQVSNNFVIATEKGTTGGGERGLELQTNSVARLTLGSAGGVTVNSGNLVLTDNDGAQTATFDAQAKLTANRTYDLPDASGTIALTNLIGTPCEFIVACSDESTNLTTGTAKVTFRAPYAFTLTAVRASVNTAPTGSTLIADINEGGSTVLSTKLSIDASEKTSTTAASAAVISDSAIADDAELTIDIDQIGSTIAGNGLKVTLIGTRA